MLLNWDDLFFNPTPVTNAATPAPNPWVPTLEPVASPTPQPAPAAFLPWEESPALSPKVTEALPSFGKVDYDPFKAFRSPEKAAPTPQGALGSSFGIMDANQQQQWLKDQFAAYETGQKRIASLEKLIAQAPSPYAARALQAQLANARAALPDINRLREMEGGFAPLPTKTGLRTAAENVPRGFAESVLSIPEFAGIVKGYLSPGDVDDDSLLKWSQSAKKSVAEMFPGDEARQADFDQQLATGLGQIASFYGGGALAALAKAGPKAMGAVVGVMGASGTGAAGFEEATRALETAKREALTTGNMEAATELDRLLQTFGYAAVGTTEALPIVSTLTRALPEGSTTLGRRVMGAAEGGLEEALQEAGSQTAQNIIAGATTDPLRSVGEGVAQAAAVGGVLGAGMGAATAGRAVPQIPEFTPEVEAPYDVQPGAPLSFIDLVPGEGYTEVAKTPALEAPRSALPAPEAGGSTAAVGTPAPTAPMAPGGAEAALGTVDAAARPTGQGIWSTVKDWLDVEQPADNTGQSIANTKYYQDTVQTPEFKNWFGDSKITDSTGKPLVVFHASPKNDIEAFDKNKQRFGKGGYGFYFSNPKGANLFADLANLYPEGKPNVTPVFLNIRNPLVVNHVDDLARLIERDQRFGKQRDSFGSIPPDVKLKLQQEGYDGIVTWETTGQVTPEGLQMIDAQNYRASDPKAVRFPVYIVFEPEQIKSVYNKGTFDPADPRISYSAQPSEQPTTPQFAERPAGAVGNAPVVELSPTQQPREARRQAELLLGAGRAVQIPEDFTEPVFVAAENAGALIPPTAPVYALTRFEPFGQDASGKPIVRAVFRTADGQEQGLTGPLKTFQSLNAFYHLGVPGLYFTRLDALQGGSDRITGQLWHETLHALRRQRLIPAGDFNRLASHAIDLRILDLDYVDFASATQDPNASGYERGVTVKEFYEELYDGRPDFEEAMMQEAATHLVELYSHNALTPQQIEPIADIVQNMASGAYSQRSATPGATIEASFSEASNETQGADSSGQARGAAQEAEASARPNVKQAQPSIGAPRKPTEVSVYHGTVAPDFAKFDATKSSYSGDLYFTDSPELANSFAGGEDSYFLENPEGSRALGAAPRVIPTTLNTENFKTVKLGNWFRRYEWDKDGGTALEKAIDQAKAEGYDGLIAKGMTDRGVPGTQYVTWTQGTVKSALTGEEMYAGLFGFGKKKAPHNYASAVKLLNQQPAGADFLAIVDDIAVENNAPKVNSAEWLQTVADALEGMIENVIFEELSAEDQKQLELLRQVMEGFAEAAAKKSLKPKPQPAAEAAPAGQNYPTVESAAVAAQSMSEVTQDIFNEAWNKAKAQHDQEESAEFKKAFTQAMFSEMYAIAAQPGGYEKITPEVQHELSQLSTGLLHSVGIDEYNKEAATITAAQSPAPQPSVKLDELLDQVMQKHGTGVGKLYDDLWMKALGNVYGPNWANQHYEQLSAPVVQQNFADLIDAKLAEGADGIDAADVAMLQEVKAVLTGQPIPSTPTTAAAEPVDLYKLENQIYVKYPAGIASTFGKLWDKAATTVLGSTDGNKVTKEQMTSPEVVAEVARSIKKELTGNHPSATKEMFQEALEALGVPQSKAKPTVAPYISLQDISNKYEGTPLGNKLAEAWSAAFSNEKQSEQEFKDKVLAAIIAAAENESDPTLEGQLLELADELTGKLKKIPNPTEVIQEAYAGVAPEAHEAMDEILKEVSDSYSLHIGTVGFDTNDNILKLLNQLQKKLKAEVEAHLEPVSSELAKASAHIKVGLAHLKAQQEAAKAATAAQPAAPAPTTQWPAKFTSPMEVTQFVVGNLPEATQTVYKDVYNNVGKQFLSTQPEFAPKLIEELEAQAKELLAPPTSNNNEHVAKHLLSLTKRLRLGTPSPELNTPFTVALPGLGFEDLVPAPQGKAFTFKKNAGGGTKPKEIWTDQDGREYMFKPVKESEQFIAYGEALGGHISRLVNPTAPRIWVQQLNGRTGSMQEMIPNSGDINGVPIKKLANEEVAALMREHVVDWLISNHDGHAKQFLRTPNGLVGIDKGQAFKYFGRDRLATDYHPNSVYGEQEPIYNQLWRAYEKGELGKFAQAMTGEVKGRLKELRAAMAKIEKDREAKKSALDKIIAVIVTQEDVLYDKAVEIFAYNNVESFFEKEIKEIAEQLDKVIKSNDYTDYYTFTSKVSKSEEFRKVGQNFARGVIAKFLEGAEKAAPNKAYRENLRTLQGVLDSLEFSGSFVQIKEKLEDGLFDLFGEPGELLGQRVAGLIEAIRYEGIAQAMRDYVYQKYEAKFDSQLVDFLGQNMAHKNDAYWVLKYLNKISSNEYAQRAELEKERGELLIQHDLLEQEAQSLAKETKSSFFKPANEAIALLQHKLSDQDFLAMIRPYAEQRFKNRPVSFNAFMDYALQRKQGLGKKFHRFFTELGRNAEKKKKAFNAIGVSISAYDRGNADEIKKYNTGLADKLSTLEIKALHAYTGSMYGPVNRILRTEEPVQEDGEIYDQWLEISEIADLIDSGLKKLPPFIGMSWREQSMEQHELDQLKPGKIWSSSQFLSSSQRDNWSWGGNVRLHIQGQTGRDIKFLSGAKSEDEVLFPTNSQFLVKKVEKEPFSDKLHVFLQELPEVDWQNL